MNLNTKSFIRQKELPPLFQESLLKGKIQDIQVDSTKSQLAYQHPNGQIWLGDSIEWMKTLPDDSIDLIFAGQDFYKQRLPASQAKKSRNFWKFRSQRQAFPIQQLSLNKNNIVDQQIRNT